jgi:outer membrane protein assembly factor BamB
MITALISLSTALISTPLTANPPIAVPFGPGKFDFMSADPVDRLIFACHPGAKSFTVIDLKVDSVRSVQTGIEFNGIDANPKTQRVYAAGPGNKLAEYSMKSWKRTAVLPLSGPGDSVIVDQKRGVVYVDNDDGTSLWVVKPTGLKLSHTVTIKEAPEVMVLDSGRGKIFQNIKTSNTIQVISTSSLKVVAEYTLGSLTSPHGLVEDSKLGRLFSVGKNGKLAILDADTGKLVSSVDVVKGSDQIAYDAGLKRLYIPGSGNLQVLEVTGAGAKVIGSVPIDSSCHSVAVDPISHAVWIVYSDGSGSYAMKFSANK